MSRVYITGPISRGGVASWQEVEENLRAFARAAAALQARGYEACNPANNQGERQTWAGYMKLGLAQLLECDGILRLPGWEHSRGSRLEIQVAEALSLF